MKISNLSYPPLILASTSPRRVALLGGLGFRFDIAAPDCDELSDTDIPPSELVLANATLKATGLAHRPSDASIVIAADTVVSIDNKAISKPKSRHEAIRFLEALSGRTHEVYTGLALSSVALGKREKVVCSEVLFRKISNREIRDYVALSEPMDKAGAYAVQGVSCRFIEKLNGSYSNVMGFPCEVFLDELETLTHLSVYEMLKP